MRDIPGPGLLPYMAPLTRDRFIAIATEVTETEDEVLRRLLPIGARDARAAAGGQDHGAPSAAIIAALSTAFTDDVIETRMKRIAVARLALEHFRVEDRLPVNVVDLYPMLFERTSAFLSDSADHYQDDLFAKDVRYMLGLTAPVGGPSVDLDYGLAPNLALRNLPGHPAGALAYVINRAWGRWYRCQLDPRDGEDLDLEGWTRAFLKMAELLAINPDVRGVAGVSPLHDPDAARNRPDLAHMRRTQLGAGAFILRVGQRGGASAEVPAPTCYAMAWPREALLAWARRQGLRAGLRVA